MEIHLLFYLLFFSSIYLPESKPFECREGKKKGPKHIAYSISKNGFCVELNLTQGTTYEFAITDGSGFNIYQENFNSMISRIRFFLNDSCLSCFDNMIAVHEIPSQISFCRSITKQSCKSNTQNLNSATIPSDCEDHFNYTKPSTCKNLISSAIEDLTPATVQTTSKYPISSTVRVTSQVPISSTEQSTSKDLISSTAQLTSKVQILSTEQSTSKDLISSTVLSTSEEHNFSTTTSINLNSPSRSNEVLKDAVITSVTSILLFVVLLGCTVFACRYVYRKRKRRRFLISTNRKKPGLSNVHGLVICCPCSEVHRQATKELLSLINNFTDLHATSYLDMKLYEETIPQLVQQLWDSVGWIIVIESANFHHHSKEEDLKALQLCNLLTSFSVQLLKHSTKAEHMRLKTIYRVSFDLEFKEFELSQVFPELNGHIYSLLMQSVDMGTCLNFDEIERFFFDLTCKQLGKSMKNLRRWSNNNWKESSEAKNLEKALVNRMDEMLHSSGCYFIDLHGNNQARMFQNYNDTNEKECDSIGTFWDDSSFISSDILSNKHSIVNRFPYFSNSRSVYSDKDSDISSKLQRINLKTDARLNENFMKVNEEQFDGLDEMSV